MPGTRAGGIKAAKAVKRIHGVDFYKTIGALGGKAGTTGGFAAGEEGRERAIKYGSIGGTISRRGPVKIMEG